MPIVPNIDVLHRNLRALAEVQPNLARRIALPASDEHLEETESGGVYYHYGRLPRVLDLQQEELECWPDFSPAEAEIVLAGVGAGEAVTHALTRSHSCIHAWDRDPMVWRLALSRHDWSESIRSRRLVLYLGADGILIPQSPSQTLWVHPVLESIYTNELHLLRHGTRGKRALVCDGELFVRDIAESLQATGYSTYTWSIGNLSPEELAHTVAVFKPQVVFAINFSRDLSEACARFQLPLAIWEVDPTTEFLPRSRTAQTNTTVFTYRKSRVEEYHRANFPYCVHLPLAANTDRRRPEALTPRQQSRFHTPVSFVGASMVQTAQKFRTRFTEQFLACYPDNSPALVERFLQSVLDRQRQDLSTWMLPQLIAQQVPDFVQRCEARGLQNPLVLAGEIAAAEKRLTCVARLAQFGVQVWGDRGWKQLEHHGVKHRGYAGHFRELNHVYVGSQINIDIGRFYQSDIVPMRIFDILACGGFVIAEYNEDLESLFKIDEEIVCWRTPEELTEKTAYYLSRPHMAQKIASRGRQRVLQQHRIQDRVQTMLQSIHDRSIAMAG